MKLTFREKRQWMVALLVAAVFGWRDPRRMIGRVGKAIGLWIGLVGRNEKYVSAELAVRRMEVCERCFIYDHRFSTCGSPLAKSQSDLGCFCYLAAKTRLAGAECWLDAEMKEEAPRCSWKNQGLPNSDSET